MFSNYIVYIHTNQINNKKYVGITRRTVNERWGLMGQGYAQQPKFYNAIQKYGWENFTHEIIATNLNEMEALELESYYIQYYNTIENGYNILLHGINSYNRTKPVYCITTKKYYASIKEAALDNDCLPTQIIENCKGHRGPVKNNQWVYWDKEKNKPNEIIPFIPKDPQNKVAIYCIELDCVFESIREACRRLNLDRSGLQKALSGKRNGIGGYHFVYNDEREKIPKIMAKRTGRFQKVICQETKEIFSSLQAAAEFCNRTPQSIMKNCQGKNKTCAGYHFSYYQGDIEEDV